MGLAVAPTSACSVTSLAWQPRLIRKSHEVVTITCMCHACCRHTSTGCSLHSTTGIYFTIQVQSHQALSKCKTVRDRHELYRFPATFTFVLRAFATLEGIGRALDANYKFVAVAQPYATKLLDLQVGKGAFASIQAAAACMMRYFIMVCSSWCTLLYRTLPHIWQACKRMLALTYLTLWVCHATHQATQSSQILST